MPALKYPIALLTFFLALGIITGWYFDASIITGCLVTFLSFLTVIGCYIHSKRQLLPTLTFTFASLFCIYALGIAIQSIHNPANSCNHYANYINTKSTPLLKGVISERLRPNTFSEKYYFEVTAVDSVNATGKILLVVPKSKSLSRLHSGDAFAIYASPKLIEGALNPNQFDYAGYMKKQGVYHQLQLSGNYIRLGTIYNFDYYIGALREKLISGFSMHHFAPSVQNTLNALLLGQRQDMDATTNDVYKNAGVLHILAISGLHFSVLFYVFTFLLKPFRYFGKFERSLHLILLLLFFWGFAFITGLSASVVRSVVMFSIIGVGNYLRRDNKTLNSLFLSMFLLLIAEPNFIFDAGFQLSYLSVFAIVALQPLYNFARDKSISAILYVKETVAVSLSAQLGVLPLSLYYFNSLPLLFLAANVVVIPLSNIILVVGLLVILLNLTWPAAALLAGKVLGVMADVMNGFISWIASFQSLVIKDVPFTAFLMITLFVVAICFILWLYKKDYKHSVALIISIAVFQCALLLSIQLSARKSELVVFNDYKNTTIALKDGNAVTLLTSDSLAERKTMLRSYLRSNFNPEIESKPLTNFLYNHGKKILLIEKDATYPATASPDILLLSQSPRLNLERVIEQLHPKIIVADASNYPYVVQRWKATCLKQKIPFHATSEKGFFKSE